MKTFEWDGMPGCVAVQTATFEDFPDGRTKVVATVLFHTNGEPDGMLKSGMEEATFRRRARQAAR